MSGTAPLDGRAGGNRAPFPPPCADNVRPAATVQHHGASAMGMRSVSGVKEYGGRRMDRAVGTAVEGEAP